MNRNSIEQHENQNEFHTIKTYHFIYLKNFYAL